MAGGKHNDNAAALAAIAKNDIEYKKAMVQSAQLANAFYKEFTKFSKDILSNTKKDSKSGKDGKTKTDTTIKTKINNIDKNITAMNKMMSKLVKVLSSNAVSKLTSVLKSTEKTTKELVKDQKNIVKSKTAGLKLPNTTIKQIGATVQKAQSTALKNNQKLVAKKEKSNKFKDKLTTKKEQARLTKGKESKKKVKDKGGFSMKLFMKGLLKFLKTLLNPMALLMAFISRFLPYVLIFGAMLYGAWQAMGDELREKISGILKSIVGWATAVFLGWKLVPMIIKGLGLAYQAIRIAHQFQEHSAKMASIGKETTMATVEHSAEMNKTFFGMVLERISFVLKKVGTIIGMIFDKIVFVLRCAAAAGGLALVGLLVVGLIFGIVKLIKSFGGGMSESSNEFFSTMGDFLVKVVDKTVDLIKAMVGGIIELVKWLFGIMFFGGSSPSNDNAAPTKTKVIDGVTASIFNEGISKIVEPLNAINEKMIQLMKARKAELVNEVAKNFSSGVAGGQTPFNRNPLQMTPMNPQYYSSEVADSTQIIVMKETLEALKDNENEVKMVKSLDDIKSKMDTIIRNLTFGTYEYMSRPQTGGR